MTKIALITEGFTDHETIRVIIHRLLGKRPEIIRIVAKGSGNLKKELPRFISSVPKDCSIFIIVHDLDRNPISKSLNNEDELRRIIESQFAQKSFTGTKHICIPIEELEAWFWSDPEVINYIGRGKGKAHPNPDQIENPKKKLITLSTEGNLKPRYSENDNARLAAKLNLELCAKRCPAFKEFLDFLRKLA